MKSVRGRVLNRILECPKLIGDRALDQTKKTRPDEPQGRTWETVFLLREYVRTQTLYPVEHVGNRP